MKRTEQLIRHCAAIGALLGLVFVCAANAKPRFEDVTKAAGLTWKEYAGYGSSWADIDGDGLLDVWISNHMYAPNLYINNGDGTFSDRTSQWWSGMVNLDAHGGAWGDFDNDGNPDLIELAGTNVGALDVDKPFYVNYGDRLVDEAKARGLNDMFGRGRTPLWFDWNNDGRLDVFVANFPRPADELSVSRVFLQQEGGSFAELAPLTYNGNTWFAQLIEIAGEMHFFTIGGVFPANSRLYRIGSTDPVSWSIVGSSSFGSVHDVTVADFNNDLRDDILLLRVGAGADGFVVDPADRLYVNMFVVGPQADRGIAVEVGGAERARLKISEKDFAQSEILVGASGLPLAEAKLDFVPGRSTPWKYLEVALDEDNPAVHGLLAPTLRPARGVFVGLADSGHWRVEVTGDASANFIAQLVAEEGSFEIAESIGFTNIDMAKPPVLLLQNADGSFSEETLAWGLAEPLSCPSAAAGDFDNDGDVDVYLACTTSLGNVENMLLDNRGGRRFVIFDRAPGGATRNVGTGGRVSVADYDSDGQLDLLVTDGRANVGYPFHFGRRYLLHNMGSANHWVELDLEGCQSNRDGIGARVTLTSSGGLQRRVARGGMHDGAQDQRRLHFGIGSDSAIQLSVDWPSGRHSEIASPTIDSIIRVHEDPDCRPGPLGERRR